MKYRIDYTVISGFFIKENGEFVIDEELRQKGYKLPRKIDEKIVLESEKRPYVVFEDNIAPISILFDEVLGSGEWVMEREVRDNYNPNPSPEQLIEYKKHKETFLKGVKEFRQAQARGENVENFFDATLMESYWDEGIEIEFFYDGSMFFAPGTHWSSAINPTEADIMKHSAKQEMYIELDDLKKIYNHYLFIQSRINVIPNFVTKVERSEVTPEEQSTGSYNPTLFKITEEWYDTNDDNPIYEMSTEELKYKAKTKLDIERESKELLRQIEEMVKNS